MLNEPSATARNSSEVIAYVALGANLGDRLQTLCAAIEQLEREPCITVVARSSAYDTAPVGPPNQPRYLNAVIALRTTLAPQALLETLLRVERQLGRQRETTRWTARKIDLDLILYGSLVLCLRGADPQDPALEVPHPRFRERAFVLLPLAEIAPAVCDPVTGEPVESLLRACPGRLDAVRAGPLVSAATPLNCSDEQ